MKLKSARTSQPNSSTLPPIELLQAFSDVGLRFLAEQCRHWQVMAEIELGREGHARFWERLRVKVPRATRQEIACRRRCLHGRRTSESGPNRCSAPNGECVPLTVLRKVPTQSPRRHERAARAGP